MEWSNETVLKFLDYYEEEPVIWSASHPLNKKRNEVYNAWKRIEEKMGGEFTIPQLKKKKDSLMACFRIVTKRTIDQSMKNIGAGSADVHIPTWFAYQKMASFLSDKDDPLTSLSIEPQCSLKRTFSETADSCSIDEESFYEVAKSRLKINPSISEEATSEEQSGLQKRTTNNTAEELLSLAATYFTKPETEWEVVCRGWAMKLNRLPADQRLFAEKIINDTLFEAEMGNLTKNGVRFLTEDSNSHPAFS